MAGKSLGGRNVTRLDLGARSTDSRSRHPSAAATLVPKERDPVGRMALYSTERRAPVLGSFLVECSSCRREKPVTVAELVRAAFPFSIHFPLIRKFHSLMRCPSCGRRTWVRIRWQLS